MAGAIFQTVVHGAAKVQVVLPSDRAEDEKLLDLCYSLDGVAIAFELFQSEVYSDVWGGPAGQPSDVLSHGKAATIAVITNDLKIANMETVLAHISGATDRANPFGNAEQENYGVPEEPGTPIFRDSGQNAGADNDQAHHLRLLIRSPKQDKPIHFPHAYLMNPPPSFQMATVQSEYTLIFRAIRAATGGTRSGAVETPLKYQVLFDNNTNEALNADLAVAAWGGNT